MTKNNTKDIHLMHSIENSELILCLSNDGIKYLQNILGQLHTSEPDSHWHIDDFDGWLGGDIKHLIILKTE